MDDASWRAAFTLDLAAQALMLDQLIGDFMQVADDNPIAALDRMKARIDRGFAEADKTSPADAARVSALRDKTGERFARIRAALAALNAASSKRK